MENMVQMEWQLGKLWECGADGDKIYLFSFSVMYLHRVNK